MKLIKLLLQLVLILILASCSSTIETVEEEIIVETPEELLINCFNNNLFNFKIPAGTKVENINIDSSKEIVSINLNKNFSYLPFRTELVSQIQNEIKSKLPDRFRNYKIDVITFHKNISELIPNFYRNDSTEYDYSRLPVNKLDRGNPIVYSTDKFLLNDSDIKEFYNPVKGLYNKNIALWHSHGWYYDIKTDRWMWERPRLFQTVEDLIPMSVTIPYLIPMLENAGANVFVPRERDYQTNELIVDNDLQTESYSEVANNKNNLWKFGAGLGFAEERPPYELNHNPFERGTHRIVLSNSKADAKVSWKADVPETGEYAVYISYKASDDNVDDAEYSVFYNGGNAEEKFIVNQKIGGSTWIYLGKFNFLSKDKIADNKFQGVVLTNKSKESGMIVSADVVRFGGGMGVVKRGGAASGRPKFVEASKYYLQFAGMPDTLVYNLNENKNDYKDDYQSRGEYVNYLRGAPFGPNKNRYATGLGIPIDLSLAFHTDAGITRNDTTVGTLMLYSVEDADSQFTFPDGVSRFANRDLGDIVQTQIVDDIRAKYDPAWSRRQLKEAQYSEAFRPNVPAMLLELLSHQNFLDMKFMLDPRFRFDVGRAIYKGMLKFLSVQYNFDYVVQPLAPDHLTSEIINGTSVKFTWQPVLDPLEPTAISKKYKIKIKGSESGTVKNYIIDSPKFILEKIPGEIIDVSVTALNEGGESFPSETISVYCNKNRAAETVLIVNGFDRVCGPAAVESENFMGFVNNVDAGVPDKYDIGFTGTQFDFDPDSKFITNDYPGHGNSCTNFETKVIAGNTFNFASVHGDAIKNAGYSFVTVSDEAVESGNVNLKEYKFVDLILGEEKKTSYPKAAGDSINGYQFKAFPKVMQNKISEYLTEGGNLFVSGAYVGKDLFNVSDIDTIDAKFAIETLKFMWANDHASFGGGVFSDDSSFGLKDFEFSFNTKLNEKIYAVESPDAINPVNGSQSIFRYTENSFGAGTAYKNEYGVVAFGFPFETIIGKENQNKVMKMVLKYLSGQ